MGTIIIPILGMSKDEGFPGGSVVTYLPSNAGDAGLILGSGRCPGGGNFLVLLQENPWTQEPGGLQSMGRRESDTTKMSTGNLRGFPGDSGGKESACNAGDPGLIPGLGRSPGEGNGYLLQDSCLKNSMDRGAWWAIVHGVAEP